jgi:hypothetical protein
MPPNVFCAIHSATLLFAAASAILHRWMLLPPQLYLAMNPCQSSVKVFGKSSVSRGGELFEGYYIFNIFLDLEQKLRDVPVDKFQA